MSSSWMKAIDQSLNGARLWRHNSHVTRANSNNKQVNVANNRFEKWLSSAHSQLFSVPSDYSRIIYRWKLCSLSSLSLPLSNKWRARHRLITRAIDTFDRFISGWPNWISWIDTAGWADHRRLRCRLRLLRHRPTRSVDHHLRPPSVTFHSSSFSPVNLIQLNCNQLQRQLSPWNWLNLTIRANYGRN